jgi:hypothetical protein
MAGCLYGIENPGTTKMLLLLIGVTYIILYYDFIIKKHKKRDSTLVWVKSSFIFFLVQHK